MHPEGILETVLYASDLESVEQFYREVLGLKPFSKAEGRSAFYRCGDQVLLLFDPETTKRAGTGGNLPIPPHGAVGEGHVCFRATEISITEWRSRLESCGVEIEADFEWPGGGRSIYFRDPAGNCLEFAEPKLWGLE